LNSTSGEREQHFLGMDQIRNHFEEPQISPSAIPNLYIAGPPIHRAPPQEPPVPQPEEPLPEAYAPEQCVYRGELNLVVPEVEYGSQVITQQSLDVVEVAQPPENWTTRRQSEPRRTHVKVEDVPPDPMKLLDKTRLNRAELQLIYSEGLYLNKLVMEEGLAFIPVIEPAVPAMLQPIPQTIERRENELLRDRSVKAAKKTAERSQKTPKRPAPESPRLSSASNTPEAPTPPRKKPRIVKTPKAKTTKRKPKTPKPKTPKTPKRKTPKTPKPKTPKTVPKKRATPLSKESKDTVSTNDRSPTLRLNYSSAFINNSDLLPRRPNQRHLYCQIDQ